MYQGTLKSAREAFKETLEYLKSELATIRTSRADTRLVEDIMVDAYGTTMRVKELATMSIASPHLIVIIPWEKGMLGGIAKAISESGLGLSSVADGEAVRVHIPELSEERRVELLKVVNGRTEKARIAIRTKRDEAWKELQELSVAGTISEDEKFRAKGELQRLVDEYNGSIEDLRDRKEREIKTV